MIGCSAVFALTLWCIAQSTNDLEGLADGEASDSTLACAEVSFLQTSAAVVTAQSDSRTAKEDRARALAAHGGAADPSNDEQLWKWVQDLEQSSGTVANCVISLLMLALLAVTFSCMFMSNGTASPEDVTTFERNHYAGLVWWLCLSAFPSMAYASAIVGAYDLTRVLGGGAILSGLLISMCPAVSALGVLFARIVINKSTVWHARQLMISYLIMGLSGLGYCLCGLPRGNVWCALGCRCVLGFASGLSCFFRNDAKTRTLSSEQLEKAMLFDTVGSGLGLVLGPLLSCWIEHMLRVRNFGRTLALATSGGFVTVVFAPLLCVLIHIKIPSGLSTQSPLLSIYSARTETPKKLERLKLPQKEIEQAKGAGNALVSGLLMITAGHFLCQYIEAGTVLILETVYTWPTEKIGCCVGLSIAGALPLSVIIDAWVSNLKEHSTKWQRMQYCVCLCLPACCLYLPLADINFPGWLFVLGGDVLIFAVALCCAAQTQSSMLSHAPPDNVSNVLLMLELAYLGRGVSGPAARYLLSLRIGVVSPRGNYAIGMLLLVLTIFVTLTLFFRPAVRACTSFLDMACERCEISAEQMWSYTRIKPEAGVMELVVLTVWAPFGIVLATLRLTAFPLLPVLYGFFRCFGLGAAQSFYNAWMPPMLGIWVQAHGRANLLDCNARIIVGNHVSDFDCPVLCTVAPLESLSFVGNQHMRAVCSLLQTLGFPFHGIWIADGQAKEAIRSAVCKDGADASRRIVIFPEGRCTNGRGVLRFNLFTFSLEQNVLPFTIQYCNPWPVEVAFLGTNLLCNLFWLCFFPLTVYTLTFLPQASKADGETAQEYGDRIQQQIADDLAVPATKFSTDEYRSARTLQATIYSS